MPQKKNPADRGHIMTLVSHMSHMSHMSHSHMCDLNEHAEDWVSIHHVTPYLLCVIVYPGAMQESSKPNCHVFCCIDTPYVIINVCKYHQIPTKHPQASINICVTSKVPSILKRFQHFWACSAMLSILCQSGLGAGGSLRLCDSVHRFPCWVFSFVFSTRPVSFSAWQGEKILVTNKLLHPQHIISSSRARAPSTFHEHAERRSWLDRHLSREHGNSERQDKLNPQWFSSWHLDTFEAAIGTLHVDQVGSSTYTNAKNNQIN